MSFWGLTLESGKRYAQKVETAFHVSMAALDMKTADNSDVSVYVGVDKNDFLMCNLAKQRLPQQSLDLHFEAGEQIAFTTKGKGIVHLTGYLAPADDFPFPDEEVDEEESEEDEEAPMLIPTRKDDKKRKNESPKLNQDSKKSKLVPKQIKVVESESEESEDGSDDEMESGSDEAGMWEDADNSASDSDDESDDGEEAEEEEEEEVIVPTPKSKKQDKQQKTPSTPSNKTPTLNGSSNQKESGKKKNKEEKGQTPKSAKKENQQSPGKNAQTPGKTPKTQQESPQKKVLAGGVIIEDLNVGTGPVAKPGRSVSVYYAGRLKSNNKMFDSSQTGAGFRFRLGQSEVIKGWDVGVQGMKVGGKRKIICPPHMAYGQKGSPPAIPPNSFLVFDVELKQVS